MGDVAAGEFRARHPEVSEDAVQALAWCYTACDSVSTSKEEGGAERVSDAIVIWSGWGETTAPVRDEERLVARLGAEVAVEPMPMIRALEDDFYTSDARFTIEDLKEMGDVAAGEFRARHPEVSEE